jgi:hypothetical protein
MSSSSSELKNDLESNKYILPEMQDNHNNILHNFCYISKDDIIINYQYFKIYTRHFSNVENILWYLIQKIEEILKNHKSFNVHLKIKSLTLIEIDKHKELISTMSILLKEKFPDKLNNCLIYDAPFIFSTLFSIISKFIDKDTQKKIKLIK